MSHSSLKTLLITGAGKRLGKLLAEHYLQAGYRVVAHFNSVNELPEHPNLIALQANLSDSAAVARLCDELAQYGSYSGVIHNASCFVADGVATQNNTDFQDHFQQHFSVHVYAPMMITEALANHWAEQAWMTVISDIYSDIPNERFAVYCASKAALQNWALSMAQRLSPQVRTNIIQPGPIQFLPEHSEAYREMVLSQSLIKQELGYDAIVDACDYLAASKAVCGNMMRVDGGRFVANRYDQTFNS